MSEGRSGAARRQSERLVIVVPLLIAAVAVAAISIRLLVFLLVGAVLGLVLAGAISLPPRERRGLGIGVLILLILTGGAALIFRLVVSQPARGDGPFVTAYSQRTSLRGSTALIQERYVIEADPGVTLERVHVEGPGEIRAAFGGSVDGMDIIPDQSLVQFEIERPDTPARRTPAGFRSWESALPLLSATVTFRRPDETGSTTWPVVRCRELAMLVSVQLDNGRLIAANPRPDTQGDRGAEWRSIDVFDPTDFSPEVTLHVDESPAPVRAIRFGGRFALLSFWNQLTAVVFGAVATWVVTRARKEWKRSRQEAKPTAQG